MKAESTKPTGQARTISPSATIPQERLTASASKTEAQVYDQGITYNESGLTYNELGYAYGGVYGAQTTRPLLSMAQVIRPVMSIGQGDNIVDISGLVILDEALNPILDETGQYLLQE